MNTLNRATFDEAVRLLIPQLETVSGRQAFVTGALIDAPSLRSRISYEGDAQQFTVNLVRECDEFGQIVPGQLAVVALLEYARDGIGVDGQQRIDRLMATIVADHTAIPFEFVGPTRDGAHIFVSYSRDNMPFVQRLIRDLQENDLSIWIDRIGLKPGTPDWEDALRDAIRVSDGVILVASPQSRQSAYVRDEIAIARAHNRPVYPVWADGDEWINSIPMGMSYVQFVDMRADRYETGFTELMQTLGTAEPVVTAQAAVEQVERQLPPDFKPRNPYKGLRAFKEADQDDFFGRDALIEELIDALRFAENQPRLLAVMGASGSGKSSVVMAGLLPRLRDGAIYGSKQWLYLDPIVPGMHPLENLTIALSAVVSGAQVDIEKDLRNPNKRGLHTLARQAAKYTQLVLYIDQFEELFTLTTSEEERRQFIDLITTAATESDGALTVILSLRADFYDRPLQYNDLGTLIKDNNVPVLPMTLADLYEVVQQPAALPDVQVQFEDGLVSDILFAVRDEVGALPLLQFTLNLLFERRTGLLLTRAAYDDLGGVLGALTQHAEQTYLNLPDDQHRQMAKALFLRLIEPGQTEQDTTRRRANRDELTLSDPAETAILQKTTSIFIDARLLVATEGTIEVAHEALIRKWDRLHDWLDAAREDVRIQKRLSSDAEEWTRAGAPTEYGAFYSGDVLRDAQAWSGRSVPSANEMAFIDASVRADEKRRKHEEEIARRVQNFQRAALLLAVMVVLALIAVGGAGIAFVGANNRAQEAGTEVAAGQAALTPIAVTIQAADAQIATADAQIVVAEGDLARAAEQVATATVAQGVAQVAATEAQAEIYEAQTAVGNSQTQVAVVAQLTEVPRTLQPVRSTLDAADAQVTAAALDRSTAEAAQQAAVNDAATAQADVERANVALEQAQTQVAQAGATLTPVPLTLTPVGPTVEAANTRVAVAQTQVGAANLQADIAQTRVAQVGSTLTPVPLTLEAADAQRLAAEQQVNELGATLTPVQATAQAGETRVANANEALVTANEQIATATAALAAADAAAATAEANAALAQTRVAAVGDTLTPVQVTVQAGETQIAEANADVQLAQATVEQAQTQVGNSQTQVAVVRQLTEVPRTLTPVGATIQAADAEIAAAQQRAEDFGATLTPLPRTLTPVQATLQAGGTQVAVADEAIAFANAQIAEATAALEAADLAAATAEANAAAAQTRVAEVNETLAPVPLTLTPVGATLEAADAEIAAAQQRAQATLQAGETQVAVADEAIAFANAQIAEATAALEAADLAAATAEANAAAAQTRVAEVNETLTPVPLTLTPVGATLAAADAQRLEAQQQVDVLGQTLTPVPATLEAANATISAVDARVAAAEAQVATEVARVEPLQATAAAAREEIAAIAEERDVAVSAATVNELVARANGLLSSDDGSALTAALLSIRAINQSYSTEADAALIRAVERNRSRVFLYDGDETLYMANFSPNGRFIVTAGDRVAKVWDLRRRSVILTLEGHNDRLNSAVFSPDGRTILTASEDSSAILWDATSGEVIRRLVDHEDAVNRAVFNSGGTMIATAGDDGIVIIWDAETGERRRTLQLTGENLGQAARPRMEDVDFVATGTGVNAVVSFEFSSETFIAGWDTRTGEPRESIAAIYVTGIDRFTKLAPYTRFIIAMGVGETAAKITSSANVDATFVGHTQALRSVALNATNEQLITASQDETAIVWRTENGERLLTLSGHAEPLNYATFSPDGALAVTVGERGSLVVWSVSDDAGDVSTAAPSSLDLEAQTLTGHNNDVVDVSYSPDGSQLATTERNSLLLWNLADGMVETTVELPGAFSEIQFADNGRYLLAVTVSTGNDVVVALDAETGEIVQTFNDLDYRGMSADTRFFLSLNSQTGQAILWDMLTGEMVRRYIGHQALVNDAALSADGRFVLTASNDTTAIVWNAETGDRIHTLGHIAPVTDVAFSATGRYAVTRSENSGLTIWNRETGGRFREIGAASRILFGPTDELYALMTGQTLELRETESGDLRWSLPAQNNQLAFSPDGRFLVIRGGQGNRLVNVETGQESLLLPPGNALVFSPDSQFVTYGDAEDVIIAAVPAETETVAEEDSLSLRAFGTRSISVDSDGTASAVYNPDGRNVVVSDSDGGAAIYDALTGERIRVLSIPSGNRLPVRSLNYSSDGALIAGIVEPIGVALVWDAETGAEVLRIDDRQIVPRSSVAFSPDGRFLLTGGAQGVGEFVEAFEWDATVGRLVSRLISHRGPITSGAYTVDGSKIVTTSVDNRAMIWDATSREVLVELNGHSATVNSAAFNGDGTRVITGSSDNTAIIWNAETGEMLQTLTGHIAPVTTVDFSLDGQYVVTGSRDGSAIVWNAETGTQVRAAFQHPGAVNSVAFNPASNRVVTTSDEGDVRIWDVDYREFVAYACQSLIRDLTDGERQRYGVVDESTTCPQAATSDAGEGE